ncbi:MAG: NADH:ubiquinone oxidoreductase [Flavimaricola sp.]|nr:NADH:ubiquinone oxidoreductase [Flavimaricola sp.]
MAEPVENFHGAIASVAAGATAGVLTTVMAKLLIEISWPGAVFCGVIVAAIVAVFLLLVMYRPMQSLAEIQAARAAGDTAPAPAPAPAAAPAAAPAPAPAPKAAPVASPVAAEPAPVAADGKPEMLTAARDGGADDLKQIKGVGPKLEAMLNRMGVYHFDQIASWRAPEVAWVDENLEGFKGRVSRDNWVDQAKLLASGGETEFSKRVEDGGVY